MVLSDYSAPGCHRKAWAKSLRWRPLILDPRRHSGMQRPTHSEPGGTLLPPNVPGPIPMKVLALK